MQIKSFHKTNLKEKLTSNWRTKLQIEASTKGIERKADRRGKVAKLKLPQKEFERKADQPDWKLPQKEFERKAEWTDSSFFVFLHLSSVSLPAGSQVDRLLCLLVSSVASSLAGTAVWKRVKCWTGCLFLLLLGLVLR